jgi:tripartite-type tricarboxylate transporter receptor subunit TctC
MIEPSRAAALLAAAAFALAATLACGQPRYPSRPVRLVVPFAPGGGSDLVARSLAPRLAERLGQAVVVDNRPAASGIAGADLVAKAAPDGHTLLAATVTFVITSVLHPKLPYDGLRDFAPVTVAIATPLGLMTHPSVPAATVQEFIAHARAHPGKLRYGSSGAGSVTHLAAELFAAQAGLRMDHVPYKGIAATIAAQLGNEVQVSFGNLFSTLGHWRGGRLRALGHGGTRRVEAFPEVPTLAEAGVPGFEARIWYGYMVPAKTPGALVARLYREIAAVATAHEARSQFLAQGNEVLAHSPEEFAQLVRAEAQRWGAIGRKLGVTLD